MSGALLSRRAAITVDNVRWDGLRVRFHVEKTLQPEPNPAEIQITNLSPTSRSKIVEGEIPVLLEVGYGAEPLFALFLGDMAHATHAKEGNDWSTSLSSGDGEAATRSARCNISLRGPVGVGEIASNLIESMGVGIGNAKTKIEEGDFGGAVGELAGGFVAAGRSFRKFDDVMRTAGVDWSVQDGELLLLDPTEIVEGDAVVLSSVSGLIGSPRRLEGGLVEAVSLIQPGLMPGREVRIESEDVNGPYRIERAVFDGDSMAGGPWYATVEGKPIG